MSSFRAASTWPPGSTDPRGENGPSVPLQFTCAASNVGLAREQGVVKAKVGTLYSHEGLKRVEVAEAVAARDRARAAGFEASLSTDPRREQGVG